MKEFILSDESKNNKGFKVLTGGISLRRFQQNPVMYFNHDRDMGVIGCWENIHVKDKRLLATPFFDMKDPFAAKIAAKVEDGFIKAASIGIDEYKMNSIEGENVITSCNLYECSVCDIPSNENALALYMEDRVITDTLEIIKLSKTDKINKMNDLEPIIKILGLSATATITDMVEAIEKLKVDQSGNTLDEFVKMKYVSENEKSGLLALSYGNPDAFSAYLENRKKEVIKNRTTEGDKLITEAVNAGKFKFSAKGFWLNAYIKDPEATKLALAAIYERQAIYPLIQENRCSPGWTLNDYRKHAPQELKSNPELYQTLLEQEQEQKNKQTNNSKRWRR